MRSFQDCKLKALRIPGGWTVLQHTLFDELPINPDGTENKLHNDSPDQLLLRQLYGKNNSTDTTKLVCIDAGWKYLPVGTTEKSRNSGCYKLTAYRGDWSVIIRQQNCKDLQELVEILESWLFENNWP